MDARPLSAITPASSCSYLAKVAINTLLEILLWLHKNKINDRNTTGVVVQHEKHKHKTKTLHLANANKG